MKNKYKKAMSGVHHSDELFERIMDMTKQNEKKKIKFAPAIALAACLVILVTGILGGSAISARLNPIENYVTITAYANELKESQVFKSPWKLALNKSENGVYYASLICEGEPNEEEPVFNISGENIKDISFKCTNGTFNLDVSQTKTEPRVVLDSDKHYIKELHYTDVKSNEKFAVKYYFFDAYKALEATKDMRYDFSKLPTDTITVDTVYKDGKTEQKTLKISFDKEGYMLMEHIK